MDNISRDFSALNLSPANGGEFQDQGSSSSETPTTQVAQHAGSSIDRIDITSRTSEVVRDCSSQISPKGVALMSAVRSGDLELVESMLNEDDDCKNRKIKWSSHLYLGVYYGHFEKAKSSIGSINEYLVIGANPLSLAAYFGHPEVVSNLLNKGHAIDYAISGYNNAPLEAATNGVSHLKVAFELLLKGAGSLRIGAVNAVEKQFGINPRVSPVRLKNIALRSIYQSLECKENFKKLPLPPLMKDILCDRENIEFYK